MDLLHCVTETMRTWTVQLRRNIAVQLIVLAVIMIQTQANWFYLGLISSTAVNPQDTCSYVPGLVHQQVEMCRDNPDSIVCVSQGIMDGIEQCKNQFKHDRWNCTTTKQQDVFAGKVLSKGSREAAFIHAMTSASVVYSVTRSCSAGNLSTCTCDMSHQGETHADGWKWGGCSDDIRYGMWFARNFVDAPDTLARFKATKARSLMNLHNNEAGRLAIKQQMTMKCRCHGVSGSCAIKSCWKAMPSLMQVGQYLKDKYENSIQVGSRATKKLRRQHRSLRRKSISKHELVHLSDSPNYCDPDHKRGILGTKGRECNLTSTGPDGCDMLCCGRGYNTEVIRHVDRCQCKFVWCCHVKCKMCETVIDKHTCK